MGAEVTKDGADAEAFASVRTGQLNYVGSVAVAFVYGVLCSTIGGWAWVAHAAWCKSSGRLEGLRSRGGDGPSAA